MLNTKIRLKYPFVTNETANIHGLNRTSK